MKKIQFAVVLTEEKQTVLVIDNNDIYRSTAKWQERFDTTKGLVLFASEADKIDLSLSHYYM